MAVELHNGTFIVSLEDGWIMFQVEKHEVGFFITFNVCYDFFFLLRPLQVTNKALFIVKYIGSALIGTLPQSQYMIFKVKLTGN